MTNQFMKALFPLATRRKLRKIRPYFIAFEITFALVVVVDIYLAGVRFGI